MNDLIVLSRDLGTKVERFSAALKFLADKYAHFEEQREFWTHQGHVPELGGTLANFRSVVEEVTQPCDREDIGIAAKDIGGIPTSSVVSVDLNFYGKNLTLFLRNYKWAFWGDVNLIPYPYGPGDVWQLCHGAVKLALLELGPGSFMPDWEKVIKPALDAATSRLFCALLQLQRVASSSQGQLTSAVAEPERTHNYASHRVEDHEEGVARDVA